MGRRKREERGKTRERAERSNSDEGERERSLVEDEDGDRDLWQRVRQRDATTLFVHFRILPLHAKDVLYSN